GFHQDLAHSVEYAPVVGGGEFGVHRGRVRYEPFDDEAVVAPSGQPGPAFVHVPGYRRDVRQRDDVQRAGSVDAGCPGEDLVAVSACGEIQLHHHLPVGAQLRLDGVHGLVPVARYDARGDRDTGAGRHGTEDRLAVHQRHAALGDEPVPGQGALDAGRLDEVGHRGVRVDAG